MTKRLYDLDSHQSEANSTVLSCVPAGEGFDIVLDQTVFFPEGGGQPSDTGTLGEATVLHVREEAGEIYHRVDHALAVGKTVPGKIDWVRRFDLMQQHTGEHLLSFSFYELFAACNVGFHLALDGLAPLISMDVFKRINNIIGTRYSDVHILDVNL